VSLLVALGIVDIRGGAYHLSVVRLLVALGLVGIRGDAYP
jgi:hypothetical protein